MTITNFSVGKPLEWLIRKKKITHENFFYEVCTFEK